MMDDTYLYVRQARPDLYEEIVAFSSVVELTDEITTRAAIEKFCMYLVDACKYSLAITVVLLSCGVAEAAELPKPVKAICGLQGDYVSNQEVD